MVQFVLCVLFATYAYEPRQHMVSISRFDGLCYVTSVEHAVTNFLHDANIIGRDIKVFSLHKLDDSIISSHASTSS